MKRKHVIVVGVIAVLVVAAYYFYGGSTVPSGQQPLVRLNGSNLSSLKDTFNQSADSVRVLVLVSPAWAVCLQGASALNKMLSEHGDPRVRVFAVWEPVLPTDLGAPSTATLRRPSDHRVSQYWDKEHLISRLLGERDRASVVWDYVAVYQPGKLWEDAPPAPVASGVPIVRAIDKTSNEIKNQLASLQNSGK